MENVFRICGSEISEYLPVRDRIVMYVVGFFDLRSTVLPKTRVSVTKQRDFYNVIYLLTKDAQKRQDLIRRCHEANYQMDYNSFISTILAHGDFSTFRYVHSLKKLKYTIDTLRIVSCFGNAGWLKYVMDEMKNNNTNGVSTRPVATDNIEVVYEDAVNFKNDQFTKIMEDCARACYFDCVVIMLHEYDCTGSEELVNLFIRYGHVKGCTYLLKRQSYKFSDMNAMNCIKYNRFKWFTIYVKQHDGDLGTFTNDYIDNCITYDRLDFLKYIASVLGPYEKLTITDSYRVELAAMHSVQCLKYLYKQSSRRWISKHVTVQAMRTGNIECLKFAHETCCDWHIDTMKTAARCGNLKCMKYAYKHGCPWGKDVAIMAATFGNYDCLEFAIEHGCPCDFTKVNELLSSREEKMLSNTDYNNDENL